jgi:hypothetical protein
MIAFWMTQGSHIELFLFFCGELLPCLFLNFWDYFLGRVWEVPIVGDILLAREKLRATDFLRNSRRDVRPSDPTPSIRPRISLV